VPELPDVTIYVERLSALVTGVELRSIRLANPFVLRTVNPTTADACGRTVVGVHRLGKRVVIALDGEISAVIHLMVAGRFHWRAAGAVLAKRGGLAAFDFINGSLLLTEAGSKRRASLHLVRGKEALSAFDRGGLEVLNVGLGEFRDVLRRESHTLKRALTDPTLFSGIGNAYSDEILHRARLSPLELTRRLSSDQVEALYLSARGTLSEWVETLRMQVGDGFPEKVTAFREGMAVHGRFGKPCPVCGSPVQRIVYADNEANYCARCQTGGRLLADRALSRLLKRDWPRTLDELEERRSTPATGGPTS
jgi:formamidopyrimidine-DNA glycosylase